MGLELVGGVHGVGQGQGPGQGAEDDRFPGSESLLSAERSIAGARQRLSTILDRLAELRRRLGPPDATGQPRSQPV